jgi:hypothetical protein
MNHRALKSGPRFENAFAWDVVERPLHGDALDIKLLSIVAISQDFGGIVVDIAGLDWIPPQPRPGSVRLFSPTS